jgi:hypothetical protein
MAAFKKPKGNSTITKRIKKIKRDTRIVLAQKMTAKKPLPKQ